MEINSALFHQRKAHLKLPRCITDHVGFHQVYARISNDNSVHCRDLSNIHLEISEL